MSPRGRHGSLCFAQHRELGEVPKCRRDLKPGQLLFRRGEEFAPETFIRQIGVFIGDRSVDRHLPEGFGQVASPLLVVHLGDERLGRNFGEERLLLDALNCGSFAEQWERVKRKNGSNPEDVEDRVEEELVPYLVEALYAEWGELKTYAAHTLAYGIFLHFDRRNGGRPRTPLKGLISRLAADNPKQQYLAAAFRTAA